jgi:hypothetical protein
VVAAGSHGGFHIGAMDGIGHVGTGTTMASSSIRCQTTATRTMLREAVSFADAARDHSPNGFKPMNIRASANPRVFDRILGEIPLQKCACF